MRPCLALPSVYPRPTLWFTPAEISVNFSTSLVAHCLSTIRDFTGSLLQHARGGRGGWAKDTEEHEKIGGEPLPELRVTFPAPASTSRTMRPTVAAASRLAEAKANEKVLISSRVARPTARHGRFRSATVERGNDGGGNIGIRLTMILDGQEQLGVESWSSAGVGGVRESGGRAP